MSIGHSVRFHSTPFVVLTDTFTGEFLCGGDVGRGHLSSQRISSTSYPPHFHSSQRCFPTYGHRHNLSELLYRKHNSHPDFLGHGHSPVQQQVCHHFTAVLSSWGTPCPCCTSNPDWSGHRHSPVRQQVCTTSPQSYSPVEHLSLSYITPRLYWASASPCFGKRCPFPQSSCEVTTLVCGTPFWKSWLQDTPALPRSRATARQMVAVRFLIRKVWQKVGMEQIPLWERYRCISQRG